MAACLIEFKKSDRSVGVDKLRQMLYNFQNPTLRLRSVSEFNPKSKSLDSVQCLLIPIIPSFYHFRSG